ncbi:MAG: hypothetical protein AAAC47_08620 [Pararhizobium sp.]
MAGHSSTNVNAGQTPQAVHAGANFAFASFSSGGNKTPFSRSVSDTIHILNMPRNAKIIAAWLGGNCQDGNCGFALGDSGSATRYGTRSVSATTLQQVAFDVPMNFVFSVSDDQTSYPLSLSLRDTTSASGSMSIHVGVLWVKV